MPTTDVTLTKTINGKVATATISQIGRRALHIVTAIDGDTIGNNLLDYGTPAERDMQFVNAVRDLTDGGYTPVER